MEEWDKSINWEAAMSCFLAAERPSTRVFDSRPECRRIIKNEMAVLNQTDCQHKI